LFFLPVALVLVTHADRAASPPPTFRTTSAFNDIVELRIPSRDPRQGLGIRIANVSAFTPQCDHELAEVVGESFDLQGWPRWNHMPKCAHSERGASIQFAESVDTVYAPLMQRD
jgi:hypothetical protein